MFLSNRLSRELQARKANEQLARERAIRADGYTANKALVIGRFQSSVSKEIETGYAGGFLSRAEYLTCYSALRAALLRFRDNEDRPCTLLTLRAAYNDALYADATYALPRR